MNAMWDQLLPGLWPAFWLTILLTFWSAIGSTILGTILTARRVSPDALLHTISTFYISLVRNTHLTLIIIFCTFAVYQKLILSLASRKYTILFVVNNFRLAIVDFILYTSAFVAESLHSGINTVDFGQAEAARSLGLSFSDMFRKIVFPQAVRAAIVPLGNTLIALTKNTTIASTIGVAEASLLMKSTIENHANQLFIIFFVFALGFIILTLPMGLGLGKLSEKMAVKK